MSWSDILIPVLQKHLRHAMSEQADAVVEDIQESISTPYPPASEAPNPPHLRTGQLADGVHHIQTADDLVTTETIISSRDNDSLDDPMVPEILEGELDRPYMMPAKQRVRSTFLPGLVSRINF